MNRLIPTCILLILLPGTPLAAMYQWVDENGVTVYSQLPPPGSQTVRKVAPPTPPATPATDAQEDLRALQQRLKDLRENRSGEKQQADKETEKQARRAENCRRAKENLFNLQSRPRALVKLPDGTYTRYNAEEIANEQRAAEKIIEQDCNAGDQQ